LVRGSGRPRLSAHGAAGVGADALDHRGESIRALRRQVLGQPETPEHALRIGPNDFICAPARVDRKEDGDEAPHNMGIAVALEDEARRGTDGGAIDLVASQT